MASEFERRARRLPLSLAPLWQIRDSRVRELTLSLRDLSNLSEKKIQVKLRLLETSKARDFVME